MAANRIQIQNALHNPYDRVLFAKEVLSPVFGSGFKLSSSLIPAPVTPNNSESVAIDKVWIYGNIRLDDSTEITCYEVRLQPQVRIEQSKVAIQQYVRKLLTAGQAALINFVAPANNVWRLTLVAKDSMLTDKGVKEKTTNAKRYTFLLGPSETCKTAAERFEVLSTENEITFQTLVNAFSVEKLSKAFFDEYTLHYKNFCKYLQDSNYRRTVFNISFPPDATEQEKDKASKPIRDFVKKLLGRIVFLYFVQKKGWLGACDTNYTKGIGDFIKQLFNKSGGNEAFYSCWLTVLFFDTLNKERTNDDFKMPDGKVVKVPFLNGGLFDKEEFDELPLTFKPILFHHPDFEDTILTEKNRDNARGFLDFLDSFNFTVYEDSPDDHTVAVDPEMLGHIFENLLEDNKDKGAFYTPKEIVHYMCQESLTEYLCTTLQIKNEVLEREAVNKLLKEKTLDAILKPEIGELEKALDNVKICDPAIGSGAFPMGLLQEIFSIKELIAYETGKEWKPAETKLNIIQNSIYGVDIEKGAVDIARLRFWLSLVVDEEKPKALPNLDYKIVVGDSLVSKFDGEIVEIDWELKQSVGKADEYVKNVQRLLVEVAEKQKKYFNPNHKNKKKLQAEIRDLKIELLINQLSFNKELFISKTIQKGGFMPTAADIKHNTERQLNIAGFDGLITKLKNLLKNLDEPFIHFDWKLDFPEVLNPNLFTYENQRGFDIVIGNPPFIDSRTNNAELKTFWKKKFYSAQSGKTNTYEVFIEQGLSLLKPQSRLSFIVPIVLLNLESCKALRELLLTKFHIDEIAYGDEGVFQDANVDTMIIFVSTKNTRSNGVFRINKFSSNYDSIVQTTFINHSKITSEIGFKISVKSNPISEMFLYKPHDYLRISEVLDFYNGIATGPDKEKYFSFEKLNKNYKPLLMGNNIGYYHIHTEGRFINYDRPKLHRPREEKIFLAEEKIIMQRIRNLRLERRLVCTLDTDKFYTFNSVNNLLLKNGCKYNIRYFLALLNSKLLNFTLKQQSLNTNITQSDLELLPLRKIDFNNSDSVSAMMKIVNLVDYTLFLKTQIHNVVIDQLMPIFFEQIIDGIVYEMYFPELLRKHNREIIKYLGVLPQFSEGMSDEQKMNICNEVFNRLNEKEHPIRVNLFYMNSIPEIAIIEGKNENN